MERVRNTRKNRLRWRDRQLIHHPNVPDLRSVEEVDPAIERIRAKGGKDPELNQIPYEVWSILNKVDSS